MEFLTYDLQGALSTYLGLAIQALIRSSPLRFVPGAIVGIWMVIWLYRYGAHAAGGGGDGSIFRHAIAYLVTSLLLCIFFWPEAVLFGRITFTTDATQVVSDIALRDPDATIVSAEDTGQVWPTLREPAQITVGFALLYKMVINTPLALARAVNDRSHNVFDSLLPTQWLLGTSMTADISKEVQDWTHNCYIPLQTTAAEVREARSVEDFLPWGDSPMARALPTRAVQPGSQVGITWIRSTAPSSTRVPCDVYLQGMQSRVETMLFEQKTPAGKPLSQVIQEVQRTEVANQAQFLIYMEILRASEGAVPAPSLAGQYAALRGLGVGVQAVANGVGNTAMTGAAGKFSWWGMLAATVTGAAGGLATEALRLLDMVAWLIGIAVFLSHYATMIFGYLTLTLIALVPFLVLWMLIRPQQSWEVLLAYFVTLLFLAFVPFIYAVVDQIARVQQENLLPLGTGYDAVVLGFLTNSMRLAVAVSLGMIAVGIATAVVLYANFRILSGMWRHPV